MREFDDQEKLILRQLIRDPRDSDTNIADQIGVNVKTVTRKRQKLESEGILSYLAHVDLHGAKQFDARHLYIIKFRIGITPAQMEEDIRREPAVRSVFTETIFESHIAEMDGHVALLLFIDGKDDADILQRAQGQIIPSLLRNHGQDSIEEIQTVRVLTAVRMLRNYLLPVNMEEGSIRKDWPDEAIYTAK